MSIRYWLDYLLQGLSSSLTTQELNILDSFVDLLGTLSSSSKTPKEYLSIKQEFSRIGFGALDLPTHLGGRGLSSLLQGLIQFSCGYFDINLRDAPMIGHGRMVILNGTGASHETWKTRILAGELIGIAMTEEAGGSNFDNIATVTKRNPDGTLRLNGNKAWISRINEASAFVVFYRNEESDSFGCALIDWSSKGIQRQQFRPMGLKGWSWGKIEFREVAFSPNAILGQPDSGLAIFREHFSYYRPMVAATALGAAAAVFDMVIGHVSKRQVQGETVRTRDSTLETISKVFIEIESALLSVLYTITCGTKSFLDIGARSKLAKAHGVETAHSAVSKLALLVGAQAFDENSKIAVIQKDIHGLLYADGIHDALLRSAAHSLLKNTLA